MTTILKVFVKADASILDAVVSRTDGGATLDRGVRELVAERFVGVGLVPTHERSSGFAELRAELDSGASTLLTEAPDVVVLSLADDIAALGRRGTPEMAVRGVEADLVAVIDLIKEKVGAHVLVANASTLDPAHEVFNYHGLDEEPVSLRAHRLNLMLVGVSHAEGISIIDVDRKIAELGGRLGIAAALAYTRTGCEAIAAEVVRILEDYGFFDERPIMAQVGAKAAGS